MRSRSAGRIRENLWYLGREESGIYLLEGKTSSLIISGGMSYLAPVVLSQIRDFGIDETKIGKLLILHSHFDHVGLVPFFKRRYPDLEVYASARAWEILQMPKGIETINAFSHLIAERMGFDGNLAGMDLQWRDDHHRNGRYPKGQRSISAGRSWRLWKHPATLPAPYRPMPRKCAALFPFGWGRYSLWGDDHSVGKFQLYQVPAESRKAQHLHGRHPLCRSLRLCDGKRGGMLHRAEHRCRRGNAGHDRGALQAHGFHRCNRDALVDDTYTRNPDYFLAPEITAGIYRQTVRHIAGALRERA